MSWADLNCRGSYISSFLVARPYTFSPRYWTGPAASVNRFPVSISRALYQFSVTLFSLLFLLLFSPQHFRWCELLRWRRERERANVRNGGDWSISQLPSSPFLLVCCCLSVEWDWRPRSQTEEEEEEEKKKKKLCERVGPKKTSVDCLIPRSSPSSTFLLPIDFTTTPSVWYSLAAVYNFDVLPPFRMRPTGLLLLLQRLLLLRRLARPAVLLPH